LQNDRFCAMSGRSITTHMLEQSRAT